MSKIAHIRIASSILAVACLSAGMPGEKKTADIAAADARIQQTIDNHRGSFGGMNVPRADGEALYDIVLQHRYKSALEIGTSNGYSGLWIAWALSKTGGKLITIEIDGSRYEEALEYFRKAGVDGIIDARLGDAHEIVPALKGPFDFVFCDADKDWYINYLKAVLPKLKVGGCFAAHNVSDFGFPGSGRRGGRGFGGGTGGFLEYVRGVPGLDTEILDIPGSAGLSVSYKMK